MMMFHDEEGGVVVLLILIAEAFDCNQFHLVMASAKVKKGEGERDVVKETRVETVAFQSQAGQRDATKEPVQVVHQHHPSSATGASTEGVVSSVASAVARSIESAKETLTGKGAGGDAN